VAPSAWALPLRPTGDIPLVPAHTPELGLVPLEALDPGLARYTRATRTFIVLSVGLAPPARC
jgi:hypothetical protein